MSVILLLMIMLVAFAVAMAFRRSAAGGGRRVTVPSCGACGYCVIGLEGMICPECGKDLREVGILTPGTAKPMSRGGRLLVWTLIAPLPALLIAQALANIVTPWVATTRQERVIFVQSPKVFTTVRAKQESRQTVIGRRYSAPRAAPLPAMRTMTLTTDRSSPTANVLDVDLATGAASFTDAAGRPVLKPGPLDAVAIEQWLNAQGFTDPAVAPLSYDVLRAVQEIGTPAGQSFSRFAPNPQRGNMQEITAHPTFGGMTTFTPTRFGQFIPWVIALLVWLIGVPIVLLIGRRAGPDRLQSPPDADQA